MLEDLHEHKLHALLVTSPANVRYLSGYTGSNGVVLLAADRAELYTDPRYKIQASRESDCRVRIVKKGGLLPAVVDALAKWRYRKLGIEQDHLSFGSYLLLKDGLKLGASLEPGGGIIERRRIVKDAEEIGLIRTSVNINSEAFAQALKKFKPGMTESDLAAELDYQMRLLGAEGPAFETIVAAGERTALPHARPGAARISSGQIVLIDMGASRDGYASDMTRTLFTGRPSPKARRLFAAVLEAQLAAVDAVRAGATAEAVDRRARQTLKKHGLDKAFVHSTGHGLGLEIHEPPRIGKREKTRLEVGMAITIEPGAYLEGFGGVRIEDTVLVTERGCEVLTPTPRELPAIES